MTKDTPDTSSEAPPKDFWTSDDTIKQVIAKLNAKKERQHDLSGVHYPPDQDCLMAMWLIEALAAENKNISRSRDEWKRGWYALHQDTRAEIADARKRAKAAEAKLKAVARRALEKAVNRIDDEKAGQPWEDWGEDRSRKNAQIVAGEIADALREIDPAAIVQEVMEGKG